MKLKGRFKNSFTAWITMAECSKMDKTGQASHQRPCRRSALVHYQFGPRTFATTTSKLLQLTSTCVGFSFFFFPAQYLFFEGFHSHLSVPAKGRVIQPNKKQKQKINRAEMQISKADSGLNFTSAQKLRGLHCERPAFFHLYVQKQFSFGSPSAWRQHNLCIINSAK